MGFERKKQCPFIGITDKLNKAQEISGLTVTFSDPSAGLVVDSLVHLRFLKYWYFETNQDVKIYVVD